MRSVGGAPGIRLPRGFTLIEVLVAMVVMAILAVMAWRGVDGIVRSRDISGARLEQSLRLNTVVAQWEQDLNAVQDSTVVPAFAYDGANLRLTRRVPDGLQLVMWSLGNFQDNGTIRGDANGGNANGNGPDPERGARWIRWAAPPTRLARELQDQWMRSQQLPANEPGVLTMLTGLSQWQVFCFRGNDNAWSNCQSSNDVSGTIGQNLPARQTLPTGVRMVLTFADSASGSAAGVLTRDVALGPQSP